MLMTDTIRQVATVWAFRDHRRIGERITMTDKLDFIEEDEPVEAEQKEEPKQEDEPKVEAEEKPEPKEVEEPKKEISEEPPKEEEKPKGNDFVPIGVMLDERDKAKEYKAKMEELERKLAANEPKEPVPDALDDPEGFQKHIQSEAQRQAQQVRFELSEDMAIAKHGNELVEKANEWAMQKAKANQGFKNDILTSRNPYEFIVSEYNRDSRANSVTDSDWEQFQQWKAAQSQISPVDETKQEQSTPPPQSLAGAPSAGGVAHVATGAGAAFDDIFKD